MKNNIFRSYFKKILKSEAFISIFIVFVIALSIMGTSYALYMDVDSDTDYELVNVGDLSIGFDNGDNTIKLDNMTPTEDEIALTLNNNIFSFYIYNLGTYTANYSIKLVPSSTNEVDTKYINYQICKDDSSNCEDINTLSNKDNNIIYNDTLTPKKNTDERNPSTYYFIRIWINNKFTLLESKKINLKVVVEAKNASTILDNTNTLAGALLNNNEIIYNVKPNLNDTNNPGIYKIKDNYGDSYYFRGNMDNNYVIVDNMCFKAYRIEGDASVRLILENVDNDCIFNNYDIGKSNIDNETILDNFLEKLSIDKLKKTKYCTTESDKYTLVCDGFKEDYIGSISKNELMFSGYSLDGNYWLSNKSDNEKYALIDNEIKLLDQSNLVSNRPVITLNTSNLIKSGNGSINNPYIIK